jgi:hypothetical protein
MSSNTGDLAQLLEARHTAMLEWAEPWPACGPEGNALDAHVRLRATVHDCINLQRAADKQAGRPTMGDDERRLGDFIAVHWATVVTTFPTKGRET